MRSTEAQHTQSYIYLPFNSEKYLVQSAYLSFRMLLKEIVQPERLLFAMQSIAICFPLYLLSIAIYNRYFHPYKNIPGPFWASISTFWYFNSMHRGIAQNLQYPIHEKYGTVVRLAPNLVSISDPTAIETIYSSKRGFQKSEWYHSFALDKYDTFSERNERLHAKRQRMTAPLYTQSNALAHELERYSMSLSGSESILLTL
jgi:hypothetical protein